jgi:hypothetical protein
MPGATTRDASATTSSLLSASVLSGERERRETKETNGYGKRGRDKGRNRGGEKKEREIERKKGRKKGRKIERKKI